MKSIMIQGTSSDAGKSYITTALCRYLANQGVKVAPFKSQNMSNNSYVTTYGEEMGRAQGVQAEAAKILPSVYMNPILLKPKQDHTSEVILLGHPYQDVTSQGLYRRFTKDKGKEAIELALSHLEKQVEVLVLEGAGSPVEINLMDREIVNMYMARRTKADVILVADIDRGGVFAQIVGTLQLLPPEDRALVKGIIINKFRGDLSLFDEGISWIEENTGVPVLGVMPYVKDLMIEAEDALSIQEFRRPKAPIKIGVVKLGRVSNATDVEIFRYEEDVDLMFISRPEEVEGLDAIIIPGTKSTMEDLKELQERGLAKAIQDYVGAGGQIMGICGGYQMLSQEIEDPHKADSNLGFIKGLGLIPAKTFFHQKKKVLQSRGVTMEGAHQVEGYEIHLGMTSLTYDESFQPFMMIGDKEDGVRSQDGFIEGTYLHHIFYNDEYRTSWLNRIRHRKGLKVKEVVYVSKRKEADYDKLAQIFTASMDLTKLDPLWR